MLLFLQRPYPCASSRSKVFTPLGFGVFIGLFLLVFRPFGLSALPNGEMLWAAAGFGLVTFIVIFLEMWAAPRLFPAYFREASWTVGREITTVLADVFLIGIANLLFSAWYLHTSFSITAIIWFQVVTVLVAILPLTIWILYKQLRLQQQYAAEARMIDAHVQEKKQQEAPVPTIINTPAHATAPVVITTEQPGELLQVAAHQLLYIAAADNYIRVFYLEQEQVKQTLLRSSLKKAAAGLQEHPQFFRCHRTFLVNLDHVTEVSGNAQGYKLQLAHTGDWVPVSRSLHDEIRHKL